MNILLLAADSKRIGVALCVAQRATHCTLEGEVSLAGKGSTLVLLREPRGPELYRTTLTGTSLVEGLAHVLTWLSVRNIRVDMVTHRIDQQGQEESFLRLPKLGLLDSFASSKAAASCVRAVTAWQPDKPQFAYFSVRPHTPESLVSVIAGSNAQPPVGCPKKMKVRCETCSTN
ncbi:hypothetical protein WL29_23375 [Burkholderia ubonensis]|uniref:Uncharacterized protein n=1 Tax=Burkholderia ubonensis TaxID=101571 RepID=A0A125DMG7_9BURK|nr:hypothetical protein [Burkholderia ubonensis]KWA84301.1 hypothetical protein WL29_23375 [Burkholderia ubonensis]